MPVWISARVAILISALLGVVVLIPVAVVVGLGMYGSALGGGSVSSNSSEARLTIYPAHGHPGSSIRVQGHDWPPRSNVDLRISRSGRRDGGAANYPRLAHIVTSRSGKFDIETVIPAALIGADTLNVLVTAVATKNASSQQTDSSASFRVDPYANVVRIHVVDASSGGDLRGAKVRIQDVFGQQVVESIAANDGTVTLSGLRPGKRDLTVRHPGYRRISAPVDVGESGSTMLEVRLHQAPVLSLYTAAAYPLEDGLIRVMGVDRWSGEPFVRDIEVPADRLPPLVDALGNTYFGYLAPAGGMFPGSDRRVDIAEKLWSFGKIQRIDQLSRIGHPRSDWIWNLGHTEYGDLYYFISYSSVVRGAGAIFLVAPESGEIIFRRAMSGSQIPVLSADGSVVYLVPRLRGTIRSLDVATGEIRDTESRLPHSVMHAVSHASRKDEAFVLTSDGDLFSVHLPTANHSGPIASVPGAAWIATLPNGRVALANPVRNELVVVDPSGNEPEYAIELTSRIEWIWADPVGPYLYAGAYQESSLRVHLFDSSTLKYQHSLEFPNRLMPTGEAMPKVLSVIDQ